MLPSGGDPPVPVVPKRHPARIARAEAAKATGIKGLNSKQIDRWEHAALLYRQMDWHGAANMFLDLANDIKDRTLETTVCRLNAAIIFARLYDFQAAAMILGTAAHVDELFSLMSFLRGGIEYSQGKIALATECFSIALNNLAGRPRQYHHLGLPYELRPSTVMANLEALQIVRHDPTQYPTLAALPADSIFESPARPAGGEANTSPVERSSVKTLYKHLGMEFELEPAIKRVHTPPQRPAHNHSSSFAAPASPKVDLSPRIPLRTSESDTRTQARITATDPKPATRKHEIAVSQVVVARVTANDSKPAPSKHDTTEPEAVDLKVVPHAKSKFAIRPSAVHTAFQMASPPNKAAPPKPVQRSQSLRRRNSVELGLTALPGLSNTHPLVPALPRLKPVVTFVPAPNPQPVPSMPAKAPLASPPAAPRFSSEESAQEACDTATRPKASRGLSSLVRSLSSYKNDGAKIQKRRPAPSLPPIDTKHITLQSVGPTHKSANLQARDARANSESTQHLAQVIRSLPHQPGPSESGKVKVVSNDEIADYFRAASTQGSSTSASNTDLSDDKSSIYSTDEDGFSSRHDSILSEEERAAKRAAQAGFRAGDSRSSFETQSPRSPDTSPTYWLPAPSPVKQSAPPVPRRDNTHSFMALPGLYSPVEISSPPPLPPAPRPNVPARSNSRRGLAMLPRIRESSCLDTTTAMPPAAVFHHAANRLGAVDHIVPASFF